MSKFLETSDDTRIKYRGTTIKKLFKKHVKYLNENLCVDELLPSLVQDDIVTTNEWEKITAQTTSNEKSTMLLQMCLKLPRKKWRSRFWKFIQALEETNQGYVADKLLKNLKECNADPRPLSPKHKRKRKNKDTSEGTGAKLPKASTSTEVTQTLCEDHPVEFKQNSEDPSEERHCAYREEICHKCNKAVELHFMPQHTHEDCPERCVPCTFCGRSICYKELEEHRAAEHRGHQPAYCAYAKKGCNFEGTIQSVEAHEKKEVTRHLRCVQTCHDIDYQKMKARIESLEKERSNLQRRLENLEQQLKNVSSASLNYGTPNILSPPPSEPTKTPLSVSLATSNPGRSSDVSPSLTPSKTTGIRTNEHFQFTETDKIWEDELFNEYRDIFTWTIYPVRDYKEMAKNGQYKSIVSAPFYTPSGYKMQIQVYLDGDGSLESKGKVSIYYIIIPGKNDSDLSWPFNKTVSIEILGGDMKKSSFIHELKCISNESKHLKPGPSSFIRSGTSCFCSWECFAKNTGKSGTLTLRVKVSDQ